MWCREVRLQISAVIPSTHIAKTNKMAGTSIWLTCLAAKKKSSMTVWALTLRISLAARSWTTSWIRHSPQHNFTCQTAVIKLDLQSHGGGPVASALDHPLSQRLEASPDLPFEVVDAAVTMCRVIGVRRQYRMLGLRLEAMADMAYVYCIP